MTNVKSHVHRYMKIKNIKLSGMKQTRRREELTESCKEKMK